MGVSQPTIRRIVKKISDNPKVLEPSVEEIINRATVKEISRPEVLQAVRGLKIGSPAGAGAEVEKMVRETTATLVADLG